LQEILEFSTYLSDHPFWKAQIVQVYVDRKGEYELIPRVGAHQILMGSMDHWEQKLHNLELLYRQGFSRYGWNTYETINLKYTNQVICSKR
jgi:cell division protein FtsQ